MKRLLHCNGSKVVEADPADLPRLLKSRRGFLWLDMLDESPTETEAYWEKHFGFHPLAMEDALSESHVPKINDWEESVYMALRGVMKHDDGVLDMPLAELDLFLGKNYLITYRIDDVPAIERTWVSLLHDDRFIKRGNDYLFYRLSDEIVHDFLLLIDELTMTLDYIDDQVFKAPNPALLEVAFDTKRLLLNLRRVMEPQHDVYTKLARGDMNLFDRRSRVLFRDVEDHYVRLEGHIQSMRDLVTSAVDTYLSLVNNRMNDIMRALTILTAFFLPLSFLTGFFGMNFFGPVLPFAEWTGKTAFFITMGIMLGLPLVMMVWMRSRRWM